MVNDIDTHKKKINCNEVEMGGEEQQEEKKKDEKKRHDGASSSLLSDALQMNESVDMWERRI